MSRLLHKQYILRVPFFGKSFTSNLTTRTNEVALGTKQLADPDVSIVIRSRNKAAQLEILLQDIKSQDFNGNVEVILVDTQSTDGTNEVAKNYGVKIIPITQKEFNYPKALNIGFKAAKNKWVYTFTDHGRLASDQILKIATRSEHEARVGGVSGLVIPNANASLTELMGTAIFLSPRMRKSAKPAKRMFMGILPANASLVNKDAWQEAGGFDESYGAGGEDSALAKTLIGLGYSVVVDPSLSVHHSHGLGPLKSLRQMHYWTTLSKPRPFDVNKLGRFRKEIGN